MFHVPQPFPFVVCILVWILLDVAGSRLNPPPMPVPLWMRFVWNGAGVVLALVALFVSFRAGGS